MKIIDKKSLQELANDIYLDIKEEEMEDLSNGFNMLLKHVDQLSLIKDIDKQEVMIFPFNVETTSLREDVVTLTSSKEEVLLNAPSEYAGQFKLPKVVK